ncbi:DUF4232 domain-containing protein [Streptomyces zaomyceticus]|uniref:DUF4232 domain-containing protein n=1 Tax=Streptomyces zaomyceticus TaxID=68286 RepID=UPI003413DA4C
MRVHQLTLTTALVVAAGLCLTACNGDDGTGQGAPPAASTTPSSAGGPDAAGPDQGDGKTPTGQGTTGRTPTGQGTTGGGGTGEESGAGRCRTGDLEITATDNTIEGDPDGTVVVQLRNSGGRDCVVSGYAGVDLRTAAGPLSAKRTGEQVTPVTLKSGKSTAFGITYPVNRTGGSGIRVTGLLVTPPNETKTVTLVWPGAATLPVTEGPGSPVKVGPVGTAGQGG